jgi:catechol 2,3-dioxygenase-like lactoylglutathione lyase family enzyme
MILRLSAIAPWPAASKVVVEREGVSIEGEMEWPRGGTSLYFRDPDGHLVELATPGLWSIY